MFRFRIHILLLIALLSGALYSCRASPKRNFSDSALLIDDTNIPEGWALLERYDEWDEDEGEVSGALITFYATNIPQLARAGQYVYRYSSSRRAAWHYDRFEKAYFNEENAYSTTPLYIPEGFEFSSSTADQWRFACHGSAFSIGPEMGSERQICTYLGLYDEFLIQFNITIEVDDITYVSVDELVSILGAIDLQVSKLLES